MIMKSLNQKKTLSNCDDTNLVLTSLGGDREAFCEIVRRYQNLLCSLAYASIGDIKQSEDMAQEVFVEAWQKLDTLRDPERLKSWLCGILRFKISHYLRKEANQPVKNADEIEHHVSIESPELKIEDEAIAQQQQVLLWDTLSNIDISYREPMVLYYREQQSVERVADSLDLTVDTTKKRLSRGRKMLKEAMAAFVEEALEYTKPGTAFTAGVVALLSDFAKPAAAAAFGAGTAKTGSLFKLGTLLSLLAAFSGLISSFFGMKAGLYQSRTENERKLVFKVVGLFLGFALIFVMTMYGTQFLATRSGGDGFFYAIAAQIIVGIFVLSYIGLTSSMFTTLTTLRAQERIFHPEAFKNEVDKHASKREYKSRITFLGLPLWHIQLGAAEAGEPSAVGWIAVGSKAFGGLLAWGGVAVAPISVGIVSIGFVTCGAVGVGLLGFGAVAIGLVSFGSAAIGYKAYSSLSSLGWESAFSNGFSIAHDAAVGPFAFAEHVNNDMAYQISSLAAFAASYQWALAAIAIMVIVPSALYAKFVKKRMKVD